MYMIELSTNHMFTLYLILQVGSCQERRCPSSREGVICCSDFYMKDGNCTPCVGSFGINCSSTCPYDYYGIQCKSKCDCKETERCDLNIGCVRLVITDTTEVATKSPTSDPMIIDTTSYRKTVQVQSTSGLWFVPTPTAQDRTEVTQLPWELISALVLGVILICCTLCCVFRKKLYECCECHSPHKADLASSNIVAMDERPPPPCRSKRKQGYHQDKTKEKHILTSNFEFDVRGYSCATETPSSKFKSVKVPEKENDCTKIPNDNRKHSGHATGQRNEDISSSSSSTSYIIPVNVSNNGQSEVDRQDNGYMTITEAEVCHTADVHNDNNYIDVLEEKDNSQYDDFKITECHSYIEIEPDIFECNISDTEVSGGVTLSGITSLITEPDTELKQISTQIYTPIIPLKQENPVVSSSSDYTSLNITAK